jgi:hypothetical protein
MPPVQLSRQPSRAPNESRAVIRLTAVPRSSLQRDSRPDHPPPLNHADMAAKLPDKVSSHPGKRHHGSGRFRSLAGTRRHPLADYPPVTGRVILSLPWPELSAREARALSSGNAGLTAPLKHWQRLPITFPGRVFLYAAEKPAERLTTC